MKPLIGLCANYTDDDSFGIRCKIGAKDQDWQLLASDYVNSITRAGGVPVIIPVVENIEDVMVLIEKLDGVVFTGGSDVSPDLYGENPKNGLGPVQPVRDKHEVELFKRIYENTDIPVLGICRGLQIINVALGGNLFQDLKNEWVGEFNHAPNRYPKYYPTHEINIVKDSKLHDIFQTENLKVNSFHHQGVKILAEPLKATMKAEDGMIEGVEIPGDRFIAAVQWHPEMMVEKYDYSLTYFEKFVEICSKKQG